MHNSRHTYTLSPFCVHMYEIEMMGILGEVEKERDNKIIILTSLSLTVNVWVPFSVSVCMYLYLDCRTFAT